MNPKEPRNGVHPPSSAASATTNQKIGKGASGDLDFLCVVPKQEDLVAFSDREDSRLRESAPQEQEESDKDVAKGVLIDRGLKFR